MPNSHGIKQDTADNFIKEIKERNRAACRLVESTDECKNCTGKERIILGADLDLLVIPRCLKALKFENAINLDLSSNKIEKIQNIDTMQKLEVLNLESNLLMDVNGLKNIKSLKKQADKHGISMSTLIKALKSE